MERKIGDKFEYIGKTLLVVEGKKCKGCYFNAHTTLVCRAVGGENRDVGLTGSCCMSNRYDNIDNVIFVEVAND